jgi:hypothetical protein
MRLKGTSMASSKNKTTAATEDHVVTASPSEDHFVDETGTKHEIRQFQPPKTVLTRCGKRIEVAKNEAKKICPDCAGLS